MKYFLFCILSLCFCLSGGFKAAANENIINNHKCTALPIPIYDENYNREVGSYDYLPYALASMNAYGDADYPDFTLTWYDRKWQLKGHLDYDTGAFVNYYFKEG